MQQLITSPQHESDQEDALDQAEQHEIWELLQRLPDEDGLLARPLFPPTA